jgi:hypothetical protein
MIPTEIRRWVTLAAVIIALIFVGLVLAWCAQGRSDTRDVARTEAATGKALDNVAAQTPIIRQEQEEKQADVDKIEGSDTRLPDGYGARLEEIRRSKPSK